MDNTIEVTLQPIGKKLQVQPGTRLQDLLFDYGVEFPCGGRGRCRGCKVKLLQGTLAVDQAQQQILTAEDIAGGWRLACRCMVESPVSLQIGQWEASILEDNTAFQFTPADGLGLAIDLGTTTLVAQLLDRQTGRVLAVQSALNPQARHGADLMTRIQFALSNSGQNLLQQLIREKIGAMVSKLLELAPRDGKIQEMTIVGNAVMHNLFCGIDVSPLSYFPFEPVQNGLQWFRGSELGWPLDGSSIVRFLPCLGGFVGSDILAGILATRLHESNDLLGLVDLGTNGEIVLGNRDKILCASTAAGPAFEGARISMGMQALTGAINSVVVENGRFRCQVLGNVAPRGICGSGLVDAIGAGLDTGMIDTTGRLTTDTNTLPLLSPVILTQRDIRELQLAKGAIAAGIKILLNKLNAHPGDVHSLYLAGAFGNYINPESARRIGLLDFVLDKIIPAGNTALLGAKLALFRPPDLQNDYSEILSRVEHVSLNADVNFQEIFAEEMLFPQEN